MTYKGLAVIDLEARLPGQNNAALVDKCRLDRREALRGHLLDDDL